MKTNPNKKPSKREQELRDADLTELERLEQVPEPIRGLPAKYGIKSSQMALTWAPRTLKEKLDDSDPKIREKAQRELQRAYFVLLNLMRVESGLDHSMVVPEEWPLDELVGVDRNGRHNFGNTRLRSRQVQSDEAATRYALAKDAEPGTAFRMLGYKDNIYLYLEGLRYYGGADMDERARRRVEQSDRHQTGRAVLKFVDEQMGLVLA